MQIITTYFFFILFRNIYRQWWCNKIFLFNNKIQNLLAPNILYFFHAENDSLFIDFVRFLIYIYIIHQSFESFESRKKTTKFRILGTRKFLGFLEEFQVNHLLYSTKQISDSFYDSDR